MLSIARASVVAVASPARTSACSTGRVSLTARTMSMPVWG
jgi:hypothetical protein